MTDRERRVNARARRRHRRHRRALVLGSNFASARAFEGNPLTMEISPFPDAPFCMRRESTRAREARYLRY